ncbi:GAF domain-containing protein [Chitinimonas sp.]|uniref:GAF domain-containing protein n=1 Tax=Chitinimonas sp. TaxID=1934313 RepID=UPI0035B143BB
MPSQKAIADHQVKLLQAIAPFRGEKCLAAMVLALTRELDVKLAMITEKRQPQAHALALADRDNLQKPFFYDHGTTPCRTVLDGESLQIPCNLSGLYPIDAQLEAYIGVPLAGSDGSVLGLLAVMDEQSISDTESIYRVLQPLAPRIAAELECIQARRRHSTPQPDSGEQ